MIDNKIVVYFKAPFLTMSGYGVHSRQILDYLLSDDRFIVVSEPINWGACAYIHNDSRLESYYRSIARLKEAQDKKVSFDLSIQVTIPIEFQNLAPINIGVTAGIEVDRAHPAWLQKCNEMDLVIVPSEFSKKVLLSTVAEWQNKRTGESGEYRIEKPVHVIPEWFEVPSEREPTKISEMKFDTRNNFLFVGQWGNKGGFGEDRKNIADLVRNFYTIYAKDPHMGLVLKINSINNSEQDYANVVDRLGQIKMNFSDAKCKIHLIHGALSENEMWDLYEHSQISGFISLTHGEGYGIPTLEASAAGLPVIATNWSGHLDFLRKDNGFIPIDYSLVEIPKCQVWENVIQEGSQWAKFDEADLKKKWRKVARNSKTYKRKAQKNKAWVGDNFGKEAVMLKWKEFFDKSLGTTSDSVRSQVEQSAKSFAEDFGIEQNEREKVLFVMPRSAGDVLISTAIVDSLIKSRHMMNPNYEEGCDFYFATLPQYQDLLEDFPEYEGVNFEVIDFHEQMLNNDLVSSVWDVVYNPGVNVQYTFSNWRLGNGDYSVKLLAEFAKACNLHPTEITDYAAVPLECDLPTEDYYILAPGGAKSAKEYQHWDDVVSNLKEMLPDLQIIQVGFQDEKLQKGVLDYRGKTFRETLYMVKHAKFVVSVDSFPAHAAASQGTPYVVLYGSTDTTVSPVNLKKKSVFGLLVETTDRNGCKSPCFKDSCFNLKDGRNCISNIEPKSICLSVKRLVEHLNKEEESETQLELPFAESM